MRAIIIPTAFLLLAAGPVLAQGVPPTAPLNAPPAAPTMQYGASAYSPGAQFLASGPVAGTYGASGYAPGTLYQGGGSINGLKGAAGYAPGHQ